MENYTKLNNFYVKYIQKVYRKFVKFYAVFINYYTFPCIFAVRTEMKKQRRNAVGKSSLFFEIYSVFDLCRA